MIALHYIKILDPNYFIVSLLNICQVSSLIAISTPFSPTYVKVNKFQKVPFNHTLILEIDRFFYTAALSCRIFFQFQTKSINHECIWDTYMNDPLIMGLLGKHVQILRTNCGSVYGKLHIYVFTIFNVCHFYYRCTLFAMHDVGCPSISFCLILLVVTVTLQVIYFSFASTKIEIRC